VGNPERIGRRGRPRRKWEYKVKMELEEIGWESVGLVTVAWNMDRCRAAVNTVMNIRAP
jgi:hypothetical protein